MPNPDKNNDQHANLDLDQEELHTPLNHIPAKRGEQSFKLDNNTPFYFPGAMPPVLDIVDGHLAPPTEVDGDVYVLEADAEGDIDEILFQAGNTIRASFNGPFTPPAVDDFMTIANAANPSNNGTFLVTGLPGGGDIDYTNPNRNDATDDELSDSPAVATWSFDDWDGAKPKSWNRYDAANDVWVSIDPQDGNKFLNETTGTEWFYDGIWNENVLTTAALLKTKSGVVAPGAFAGNPKIAAVVFAAPFADANYSVSIVGIDSRAWNVQAFGAAGFTINSNANPVLTGNVYWIAVKHGEEP